jgi:hypothetical protein
MCTAIGVLLCCSVHCTTGIHGRCGVDAAAVLLLSAHKLLLANLEAPIQPFASSTYTRAA